MTYIDFSYLRVYIEEKVHDIYANFCGGKNRVAEDKPFIKMPDLFVIAASVGLENKAFKELEGRKKDIFLADAFNKDVHISVLATIAFSHSNDLSVLLEPREVLNIAECYANGGISYVHEIIISGKGLHPLYKFIDFIQRS